MSESQQALPASVFSRTAIDPSTSVDAPPLFGREINPHIYTVSGRQGVFSKSYLNQDEATRDSRANAERMRTDCGIMEPLEARKRATALLPWSIEPEEESVDGKELAAELTKILKRTRPNFTEMRSSLLDALWFGRSATAQRFGLEQIGAKSRSIIKHWSPRHGDKLVFRYDDGSGDYDPDQVGIRVNAMIPMPWNAIDPVTGKQYSRIQPTNQGLVQWLDSIERRSLAVHKHSIEDGAYEEPWMAGRIHGVGIRDRIYWTWYVMVECMQRVVEYIDRAAFGIEIWPYQQGNPQHQADTERAATKALGGGRSVILAPLPPGESPETFLPRVIQPGLGGINTTMDVLKSTFALKIKRYILGQELTSEATATGLGSGVADAHMATLADIVAYDAGNLEETITHQIVYPLQLANFRKHIGIRLNFKIDLESPQVESRMKSYKSAWDMGLKIRSSEIYDILGAVMPSPEDQFLANPAMAQAMPMASSMVGNAMNKPVLDLGALHKEVMNRMAVATNPTATPIDKKTNRSTFYMGA